MSRPQLPPGHVFAEGPFRVCRLTYSIWGRDAFGDSCRIVDIRGWGYLTGQGHRALALPPEEALAAQLETLQFIAKAMNEAAGYVVRPETKPTTEGAA